MSGPRQLPNVPAALAPDLAAADASAVPRLARGVVRLGPMAGSGYRVPPRLARRGDGQVVQLTPLVDAVLEAIDGQCDLSLVTDAASEYSGRDLHVDDVHYLIEHKLRPLGLVCGPDGSEPVVAKVNPLLGLRGRIAVTRPDRTRALTRPFLWLFRPTVVALVTAAFTVFSAWVLLDRGLDTAIAESLREPGTVLVLIGLVLASAAFHEIGHAAACRYGGAEPGVMGAALYLVWPAFYTDVTDSYRLSRAGRLRVDLGGLYFNAVFALGSGVLWVITGAESLLVLVPVQLLQMVRQLIPLVRFDGYHILADLIGVPDLFARIKPTLARALPWNWRDRTPNPLRPWAQAVVVTWVALVIPALAVTFGLLIVHLPDLVIGSIATIRAQSDLVSQHLALGNHDAVALGLISILLVAFVPASSLYLTTRLAHRTSRSFWRATDGHPLWRTSALAAVVAVLLATGPGLLPGERNGAPIAAAGPGEIAAGPAGGRVVGTSDAEEPAVRPLARAKRQVDHAAVGATTEADPAVDRSEPVSTRRDVPAAERSPAVPTTVVRSPKPTVPEVAWPFPFDPPAPPAAGDNQAVVANWTDGARRFDLSADLQWDEDDSITQANRAYALAMCTGCRTVAAAFQIVVATVPNRVAVPENLAVAVNNKCVSCVTEAVAVQLVLTLDGPPDRSVRNRLEALVKSVDARAAWFAKRTPSEILAEFRAVEAQAMELLAPWMPETSEAETATESEVTTGADPATGAALDVVPAPVDDLATDPGADAEHGVETPAAPADTDVPSPDDSRAVEVDPVPTVTREPTDEAEPTDPSDEDAPPGPTEQAAQAGPTGQAAPTEQPAAGG